MSAAVRARQKLRGGKRRTEPKNPKGFALYAEARRHLRAIHRHLVTWVDRHTKEMVAMPLDIGSQGHQSRDKMHALLYGAATLLIAMTQEVQVKFVTQESA